MSTVIEDRKIGSLAARLGQFAVAQTWELTDEQLTGGIVDLARMQAGMDELMTRWAGAAEDRNLPTLAGAVTTTAWLANLTGLSRRESHRIVIRGGDLSELVEETRQAWAAGVVTTEQASIICKAINTLPDWVGEVERVAAQRDLLEKASRFSTDDLKRLANRVIEAIDPDGAEEHVGKQLEAEEQKAFGKTEFSMFNAGDAMVRGRFLLPLVQAGVLKTVLEGLASPRRHDFRIHDCDGKHSAAANGTLTHNQKLGRAFCELIEHLPSDAMPQHGGLAATVTINLDFEALKQGIGTAVLSTGDEMSASQARRFACNAQLIPVVLDGKSKILELGLAKRLFGRYQRIGLANRDKGCCWKGCDRPPAWCEAHHLQWWSRGGPTDLKNGALFCFYHHHLMHNGEWWARMASDGIIEVIPPKRIDPEQKPMRHSRFKTGP